MDEDDRMTAGDRPTRILLVEDHRLVREGIKLLLEREPDMAVAGEATDGEAGLRLVAQLAAEEAVDVVVSDIGLPGIDGLELTRRIKALVPGIPVVLLTMHDGDEYLRGMLEAGADGYVLKQTTGQDLCAAIRAVLRGEPGLSPAVAGRLLRLLRQGEPRAGDRRAERAGTGGAGAAGRRIHEQGARRAAGAERQDGGEPPGAHPGEAGRRQHRRGHRARPPARPARPRWPHRRRSLAAADSRPRAGCTGATRGLV